MTMPDLNVKPYKLLPERTKELIGVIGYETTMQLVEKYKGTHLNIPKNPKESHFLAAVIDFQAFKKLCAYYGGTVLEIDLCTRFFGYQKKQLIFNDMKNCKNQTEIAQKYKMTARNVRRIKQQFSVA
jgi:Mor family transcriptional regulator